MEPKETEPGSPFFRYCLKALSPINKHVDTKHLTSPETEVPKLELPVKRSQRGCGCRRSKCLKLYCECFAAGNFCQNCGCTNCSNRPQQEKKRNQAINETLNRNPQAFYSQGTSCNCKKSNCRKNYCECYQSNKSCTKYCKCEGCKNN
mmetsp:Transcript_13570/g.19818  ORF Transcript_13570/g.19818 Transcript_13570/m.19818 type:complete len:148 (+) Transcript_13570:44-487(+)